MDIKTFNYCLLAGWLMATAGAVAAHVALGMMFGGISLVLLTLYVGRLGGLFMKKDDG